MTYTELQERVIEVAQSRLRDEPWYHGICLDELASDTEIREKGIAKAAQRLIDDTMYWDDPSTGYVRD